MLVLSRKKNERIVLIHSGVEMVVTVADVKGDKIRLGIEAPIEVKVYRQELWEVIKRLGNDKR